jgi:hypothetical protein
MERLDRELRSELGRLGAPDGGDLAAIVAAWPELVGPTIARNAWPLRIGRDGTLHVATASATWAFELGRLASELETRLRGRLRGAAPAALRFAPGPLPEPPAANSRGRPATAEITPADRAEAASFTAEVGDEELRELLSRAVAAALARARSDRRF